MLFLLYSFVFIDILCPLPAHLEQLEACYGYTERITIEEQGARHRVIELVACRSQWFSDLSLHVEYTQADTTLS